MAGQLPEDILFDIFIRMPTEPLFRLRCLSKHWNRTISAYFMKTKSRSRRMLLLPLEPLHAIEMSVPQDGKTFHSMIKRRLPFINKGYKDAIIVGTFNGIVLLVLHKSQDMVLYNPFTGAFKMIPKPPLKPSYTHKDAYGFYYDTPQDELKIVIVREVVTYDDDYVDETSRSCNVFSLKTGVWARRVKTLFPKSCLIIQYAGTFLNGFLYWIGHKKGVRLIVALDVKEMLLSEIQIPLSKVANSLGLSGGRLQILSLTNNSSAKFELWAMNEHGNERSWSKVLTSKGLTVDATVNPLAILDEGKIALLLFKKRREFIIYDMLKHSYDQLFDVNMSHGGHFGSQAIEYVESLMSPSDLCSSLI